MTLDARALNRATLERQLLTRRVAMPVPEAVERLVAMQSQVPTSAYYGLWSRLDGFEPDQLGALVADRSIVRLSLLRGTIHLVTARDCVELRPLLQPLYERNLQFVFGAGLDRADVDKILDEARALLEEQPRTFAELGKLLGQRWPQHDPGMLTLAVRSVLPLVQVPPRGVWGSGGPAAHTTAQCWLGTAPAADPSPERLLRRYPAAFGPAGVKDMQTWCGLTRLGEVVDRLRPQLQTFRDEAGNELLDVPDAPLPDPDTPIPVRFLPEYDNCLRSHADRSRVMTAADRALLATVNDAPRPTVLVDGFLAGRWRLVNKRGTATLTVMLFRTLPDSDTTAVAEEGERLLAFAAPGAQVRRLEFGPL